MQVKISLDNLVREFETGEILAVLVAGVGIRTVVREVMGLCYTNAAEDIGEPEDQAKYQVIGEELEKALEAITARLHPVT